MPPVATPATAPPDIVALFRRRQRVIVGAAIGDHTDKATVLVEHVGAPGWFVVRLEDGAEPSVHASNLRAVA